MSEVYKRLHEFLYTLSSVEIKTSQGNLEMTRNCAMADNANTEWTSRVFQASALGMAPLARQKLSPVPSASLSHKRVVINVSGRRYETWEATLSRHPETLLGSQEREYFRDEKTGEYVFDRDPSIFRHILNYYRTGRLHFSYYDCSKTFEEEFKFFGIPFDGFDSCCWNEVNDSYEAETVIATTMAKLRQRVSRTHFDNIRETIWDTFENPQRTRASRTVYNIIVVAVALSLLVTTGQTIRCPGGDTCGDEFHDLFLYTDGACAFIFTVEYVVKLYAVPYRKAFVKSLESFIDILAILPFYFDLLEGYAPELKNFSILRVFRVFRVFKLLKNSKRLKTLLITFRNAAPELGVLCFIFAMGTIMFAACVYYLEKNVPGTTFTHIPLAIWYAIITGTTLG